MSVPAWDRTRWDRLQACGLLVGIAVLSALPGWVAVMALYGTLR